MEHTALYRKYRSKNWDEIVGQEHITDVLADSVAEGKASHAYLFVGSRGTGKTSVARIFAEALEVSANDLYEIDAASNRGIDDIRELRDGVRALPFDSKYKVYIIDEVHMLSKDAWGALLKTLEEPPKHVIFILATTELQKVPETIISRCQVFNFKRPTENILKGFVADIAKKEGYTLEPGVAELLAILGDGSFRDTLGVLQKILNFTKGKKITREAVEKIAGLPKTVLVNEFLESIAEENVERGMEVIANAEKENLDMKLFLKLVIIKFRMAIILRYAPKLEAQMAGDLSADDLEFLRALLKKDTKGMLRSKALAALLSAYADMDNSFISAIPLELALVKILGE